MTNRKRLQEAERVVISCARNFEDFYRIDEVLRNHDVEKPKREEILRDLGKSADRIIDRRTGRLAGRPTDDAFRDAAKNAARSLNNINIWPTLYEQLRQAWPEKPRR